MQTIPEDAIPEGMKDKAEILAHKPAGTTTHNDWPGAGSYRGLGEALQQALPMGPGLELLSKLGPNKTIEQVIGTPLTPAEPKNIILPHDIDERPMVQHAARELRLAGLYDHSVDYGEGVIARNVLDVIKLISSQGHSGGSMDEFLTVFDRLIRRKPLTKLTDDPAEWTDMLAMGGPENMRYQNNRDSSCFSGNGGKTYWQLSESGLTNQNQDRTPKNVTVHVEPTGPHPVQK